MEVASKSRVVSGIADEIHECTDLSLFPMTSELCFKVNVLGATYSSDDAATCTTTLN